MFKERIGGVTVPEPVYGASIRSSGGGTTRLVLESADTLHVLSATDTNGVTNKTDGDPQALLLHDKNESGVFVMEGENARLLTPRMEYVGKLGDLRINITATSSHGIQLDDQEPTQRDLSDLLSRFD